MHLIHLPQFGYTMESGTLSLWLLHEGDDVAVGDALCEIETQKDVVEVAARLPGRLARLVGQEGEEYGVGALLAVVADPGEQVSSDDIDTTIAADVGPASSRSDERPKVSPSERQVDTGRAPRVRALPKVKAYAAAHGVDLGSIQGTGPNGTVSMDDVVTATRHSPHDGSNFPAVSVAERRPLGAVERSMAETVSRSWQSIPHFVQQFRVDLTDAFGVQEEFRRAGHRVGLTEILIAAIAEAVQKVPLVNSSIVGENIEVYEDVNVSVAVATDRGLMVPVLERVQGLDLEELPDRLKQLVATARSGSALRSARGTITLSNLSRTVVETGLPIISTPQVTTVFSGSVIDTPVAIEGKVVIRPLLGLAIAYDHRVIDGQCGANFCEAIKDYMSIIGSRVKPK